LGVFWEFFDERDWGDAGGGSRKRERAKTRKRDWAGLGELSRKGGNAEVRSGVRGDDGYGVGRPRSAVLPVVKPNAAVSAGWRHYSSNRPCLNHLKYSSWVPTKHHEEDESPTEDQKQIPVSPGGFLGPSIPFGIFSPLLHNASVKLHCVYGSSPAILSSPDFGIAKVVVPCETGGARPLVERSNLMLPRKSLGMMKRMVGGSFSNTVLIAHRHRTAAIEAAMKPLHLGNLRPKTCTVARSPHDSTSSC
jgi:hypothetical protein